MKTTNTRNGMIFGLVALLALLPFVAADSYQLWCLQNGQTANFAQLCAPGRPIITAPNPGTTQICVHAFNDGRFCHTNLGICNGLGLNCSIGGGGGQVDAEPPVVELLSPQDGDLFTTRNVLVQFTSDEPVTFQYQKASDPRRWVNVCSNCMSYAQARSFEEGLNEVTFRAVDNANNEAFIVSHFNVDSKDPRLRSLKPDRGFASGDFEANFEEDNPASLVIHYGNVEGGLHDQAFNLDDCIQDGRNRICNTHVDLSDFDGEHITVYGTLTDLAGNIDETAMKTLEVDYSVPIINSLDYAVDGKKVTFTVDITEPFLSEVTFMDNSESRPREKKLCNALVNDVCEKRVSFNKDGEHEVTIFVRDEAGNSAEQSLTLFTDSKVPKIKDVMPNGDFAQGLFEIEFEEANPVSVALEYGNVQEGFLTTDLPISQCNPFDGTYYCSKTLDLTDYDGQMIDYHFTVTDLVGQSTTKGEAGLTVDKTFPVVDSIDYTLSGRRADVTIMATEANLDKITYINTNDARPRSRTFCTKLLSGQCVKRLTLNAGLNHLDFTITDKAGNSIAESLEITV